MRKTVAKELKFIADKMKPENPKMSYRRLKKKYNTIPRCDRFLFKIALREEVMLRYSSVAN